MSTRTADERWCHRVVQNVSRTFAITMELLREPMATHICVAYLICRVADTVEDASHLRPETKVGLLETYDEVLDPDTDVTAAAFERELRPHFPPEGVDDPEWELAASTSRVVETFEDRDAEATAAMRPPARELVTGLGTFVDRHAETGGLRLQTLAELEEYCYYAAGTVGRMITNLATTSATEPDRVASLHRQARSFGLLLQLVNVAKDVHADYTVENNVYLPEEWLADEGLTAEELCDRDARGRAAAVVERAAAHARTYLDDAEAYLRNVPLADGNRLAAWGMPYLLAVGTLRELSSRPEDALSSTGVKMTRAEVAAILSQLTADPRPATISRLREQVQAGMFVPEVAQNADR